MKPLIYIVLTLLIATTVSQCVTGFRGQANQIRVTRARRLDEAGQ